MKKQLLSIVCVSLSLIASALAVSDPSLIGHYKLDGNAQFDQMNMCKDQAYELILGDAGKVFDVTSEDAKLRERYGRTDFGASCLIARKLVEAGVRYTF